MPQFPKGHPAIARLNVKLAQELRKVGRVVDAKYAEQEVVSYAQSFSSASTEMVFEQDVEFLATVANRQQNEHGAGVKNTKSKLDCEETRPSLKWVDQ